MKTSSIKYVLMLLVIVASFGCKQSNENKDENQEQVISSSSADTLENDIQEEVNQRDSADFSYESTSANAAEWLSKAEEIADWYAATFTDYQQFLGGKMCPILDKKVRDDCSGLVTACLVNYGIYDGNEIFNSAHFRDKNSEIGELMQEHFTPIEGEFMQTDYQEFQPGDILAGYMFEDGEVQKKHGHVTIYAGNGKFYDWGGWAYKAETQPVAGEESEGYMHDHLYTIIWRMK